ncbi:hypothetical protein [Prochlorococcus marinus]|uniref:hypothetical protein n=1 Tax=Prochlorococcus marinus TaxID=1219 RepID=UPI0022B2DB87|nr:hypothetical protein [Prochlorococcus marinus]
MNQVHDHLDQGKARIDYLEVNQKGSSFDKRFMNEIWVPLYKSIYASLTSPEESNFHSPKYLIGLVDSYFISILSKYFSDEPKSAFDQIQTLSEAMNKIFSIVCIPCPFWNTSFSDI